MLLFSRSPLTFNPSLSPASPRPHFLLCFPLSPEQRPRKAEALSTSMELPVSGKVMQRKGLQAAPGFPKLQHSQTQSPLSLKGSSHAEKQRPCLIPTG